MRLLLLLLTPFRRVTSAVLSKIIVFGYLHAGDHETERFARAVAHAGIPVE